MSDYKFYISQAKMYQHHLEIEASSLEEASIKAQIAMNNFVLSDGEKLFLLGEQQSEDPDCFHYRNSGEIIYDIGNHTMLNIESEDLEDIDGIDVYTLEGKGNKRFASIAITDAGDSDFQDLDEAFQHLRKGNPLPEKH